MDPIWLIFYSSEIWQWQKESDIYSRKTVQAASNTTTKRFTFRNLPSQRADKGNPEVNVRFKGVVVRAKTEDELVIEPLLAPVRLARMMHYFDWK